VDLAPSSVKIKAARHLLKDAAPPFYYAEFGGAIRAGFLLV